MATAELSTHFTPIAEAEQRAICPASIKLVADISDKLEVAYSTLDLIFVLANTGDLESLRRNTFSSSMADVMDKIDEARDLMKALVEQGAT